MGLKLEPLGRAKPGHEAEWRDLLSRICFGEVTSADEAEQSRLHEISVPAYRTLGAPKVGFDKAADAWALANKRKDDPRADALYMEEMKGHDVVILLQGQCDGVPETLEPPRNCAEATILDVSALAGCTRILEKSAIDLAKRHIIPPEEAVAYGRQLLRTGTENTPLVTPIRPNLFGRLFRKKTEELSLQEQRQITATAGSWYMFWGVRGHPVRAHT